MIAFTSGLPKELLIAGGLPAVEHVARECAASGITDLMIVIAPGKQAIEALFARRAGTAGLPERIVFTVQREPRGLADAIRLGRDFALHGPIAVALPDNLFVAEQPALSQVLSVARATGKSAVAVVELTSGAAAKQDATTIYDGAPVSGTDEFRVTRIPNKGTRSATFDSGDAALAYTGVGRYAFDGALWDSIDAVESELEPGAELDDVPVMQQLLGRNLLTGCLLRGQFLDVGCPDGYRQANELPLLQSPST